MLAGVFDFLNVLDVLNLATVLDFFLDHLAIADDGIEWRPKLMAHVGEEGALRAACVFGGSLCSEQLFLGLFAVENFALKLLASHLQFVISTLQGGVAMLDFREHRVEAVDEAADFVIVELQCPHFVILLRRDNAHGVFKTQNRSRNQSLQFGGDQQCEKRRNQHDHEEEDGVTLCARAPLAHVRLQEEHSERFSVERNPVKNLQIAAFEPRRVRLWKVRGKGRMSDAGANVLSKNLSVRTVQNGSNDIFFRLQG